MIRTGADFSEPFVESPDVCIVGSGAGGAPAALALAEAGLSVLVLEAGGLFRGDDFTQREREMMPAFHANRGARFTVDGAINVLGAEMIGGSTVINMADCVPIPAPVLDKWRREHGITGLSPADLEPAVRWVHEMLGANRIAEEALNRNNRLLRDGSRALGFAGQPFLNSRVDCLGCGYCVLGCAYDAKQSALVTWIPRAETAGARFYADCRVTKIESAGRRVTELEGQVVDPKTRVARFGFRVKPQTVILAAGAINTPALLLTSGLANSSGHLGRNLILQPQMPIMAAFDEPVQAFRGIPQAYAVEEFNVANPERGDWGFRLEGISGPPGQMAAVISGMGDFHREAMRQYAYAAACLLLVPDEPGGEVGLDDAGRPEIRYTATAEWRGRLAEGARAAVRAYLAAGAEEVAIPTDPPIRCAAPEDAARITADVVGPGLVPLISAHPQGTCRMGADPMRSVIDPRGRAHDLDNLYVMDASMFPSTASSHIQVPIMSVSWLNAQRLARRLLGPPPVDDTGEDHAAA